MALEDSREALWTVSTDNTKFGIPFCLWPTPFPLLTERDCFFFRERLVGPPDKLSGYREEFLGALLPRSRSGVVATARMQADNVGSIAFDPEKGTVRVHNTWQPHPNLQIDTTSRLHLTPNGRKAQVSATSTYHWRGQSLIVPTVPQQERCISGKELK